MENLPSDLSRPWTTLPSLARSMNQLSVSPAGFFSVMPNTALPFLIASLRSASLELRTSLMASNATEEGNLSIDGGTCQHSRSNERPRTRDIMDASLSCAVCNLIQSHRHRLCIASSSSDFAKWVERKKTYRWRYPL